MRVRVFLDIFGGIDDCIFGFDDLVKKGGEFWEIVFGEFWIVDDI